MNALTPQDFKYDAEKSVMVPVRPKLADKSFTDGETYKLAPVEERSANTHSHYFAMLKEAFDNLPEHLSERFPTIEHLRKYCLIQTGFCNIREFACSSKAEAVRLTAFLGSLDDYAVTICKDNVVRHLTAKSQSYRAMPKDEFQDSKTKVLDYVSSLIGITRENLQRETGKAA